MSAKEELNTKEPIVVNNVTHKYTRIFYVRESALQSIIADFFTFGILILISTLNFVYWGGHWYMGMLIVFCWLVFVMGRAKSKLREFSSRSELVDYLIAELEKEGEGSK